MADDALDWRHLTSLQTLSSPQQQSQTPDSQVMFPSEQSSTACAGGGAIYANLASHRTVTAIVGTNSSSKSKIIAVSTTSWLLH